MKAIYLNPLFQALNPLANTNSLPPYKNQLPPSLLANTNSLQTPSQTPTPAPLLAVSNLYPYKSQLPSPLTRTNSGPLLAVSNLSPYKNQLRPPLGGTKTPVSHTLTPHRPRKQHTPRKHYLPLQEPTPYLPSEVLKPRLTNINSPSPSQTAHSSQTLPPLYKNQLPTSPQRN